MAHAVGPSARVLKACSEQPEQVLVMIHLRQVEATDVLDTNQAEQKLRCNGTKQRGCCQKRHQTKTCISLRRALSGVILINAPLVIDIAA
jgi:hypothetical protein